MTGIQETVVRELEGLPEPLVAEVLDFVRFLKTKRVEEKRETTALSQEALARDWLKPEEDEAWRAL